VVTAIAVLRPTEGSNVTGTLTLRQDPTQDPPLVILTVSIENAPPNSKHGFHLHQFGDTSSPKGLAQFDHFNPFNHTHGCPTPNPDDTPSPLAISLLHHVGDMGSIATDARGRATASWSSTQLSLVDPTHAGYIPGRGVIFHADADDCVTQPTGASGKRLAQGVV
ncbi:superoxide dismutase, partial [Chytriomyces sp. MP71]